MHIYFIMRRVYLSFVCLGMGSPGFKTTNKINNIIVLGTLCFVVNMSSEKAPFEYFILRSFVQYGSHGGNIYIFPSRSWLIYKAST